jgi:hypothetical protein
VDAPPFKAEEVLVVGVDFNMLKSILEVNHRQPVALMDDGGELLEALELELGDRKEGIQESHVHDGAKLAILLHDNSQRQDHGWFIITEEANGPLLKQAFHLIIKERLLEIIKAVIGVTVENGQAGDQEPKALACPLEKGLRHTHGPPFGQARSKHLDHTSGLG